MDRGPQVAVKDMHSADIPLRKNLLDERNSYGVLGMHSRDHAKVTKVTFSLAAPSLQRCQSQIICPMQDFPHEHSLLSDSPLVQLKLSHCKALCSQSSFLCHFLSQASDFPSPFVCPFILYSHFAFLTLSFHLLLKDLY